MKLVNLQDAVKAKNERYVPFVWFMIFLFVFTSFRVTRSDAFSIGQNSQAETMQVQKLGKVHQSHVYNVPVIPVPSTNEGNEEDEVNTGDSNEIDFFGESSFYRACECRFPRERVRYFQQSINKRRAISLVVLYHSWKSFLI